MISEKMNEAFNKQIKDEMYSSNLYLSMVAYFEEIGLKGFCKLDEGTGSGRNGSCYGIV